MTAGVGIDWDAIRLVVRDWIVGGASPFVAANHVIWSGQQSAIPDRMYVEVQVKNESSLDEYSIDRHDFVDAPDGSVIEHVIGDRIITLRVTVHGEINERDATRPWRCASCIRSACQAATVVQRFGDASIGVYTYGEIQASGRGQQTLLEPSAWFDVAFTCVSDIALGVGSSFSIAPAGVIEAATGSGTVDDTPDAVQIQQDTRVVST